MSYGRTSASGLLLSLDIQSMNDCCDREQTLKNSTGRFSEPQEVTPLWKSNSELSKSATRQRSRS